MKPKKIIMFIIDDILYIYQNKLIVEKIKTNLIFNSKISKPHEFTNWLEKILNKHKLNKGILNAHITFLTFPNYTQADTEIINKVLEKLSFSNTAFNNILTFLKIKKNYVYLIFNKSNIYLLNKPYKNHIETIYIDLNIFKNNINLLINHLKIFIKRKKIILLGTNNLEELSTQIERVIKTKVYFIEDTINYYINNLKNTL